MRGFTLDIPASSGNLGAGFDCFGLALSLANRFVFQAATKYRLTWEGDNTMNPNFADPDHNHLVKCYRFCCAQLGIKERPFALHAQVNVPPFGGLGSSATAALAGGVAATLFGNRPLKKMDLFHLVLDLERHPDNLAPSLFGGFTLSTRVPATRTYTIHKIKVAPGLKCRVLLPELRTSTSAARRKLPSTFARRALVANLGYAGLTAAAFASGRYNLLRHAMHDLIHEPHRDKPALGYADLKKKLLAGGALGVCLSGSGPAILLLAEDGKTLDTIIAAHFKARNVPFRHLLLKPNNRGLRIQQARAT